MIEAEKSSAFESNTAVFHRLNVNTLCLDNLAWDMESLMFRVPDKIKNRLKINLYGLNQMTTVIVAPNQQQNLDQDFLDAIIRFSDSINESIGLPETENLIVRTAQVNSFSLGKAKGSGQKFSEPMVQVINVGSEEQQLLLHTEGKPERQINSLQELSAIFPHDKYLLIHDDNERLQKRAVHGTFLITDYVSELVIRTDSLHARNIVSDKYPHIKFTSDDPEYLFSVDPNTLSFMVRGGEISAHSPRIDIRGRNLTGRTAKYISKEIQGFSWEIFEKYAKATEIVGKKAVMEFRLYPPTGFENQRRLHVLDINDRF